MISSCPCHEYIKYIGLAIRAMEHHDNLEDPDTGEHSRLNCWKHYLNEELTESWGDAILILSCFVTGLLDSAVFNVWSCFVSMQTGV